MDDGVLANWVNGLTRPIEVESMVQPGLGETMSFKHNTNITINQIQVLFVDGHWWYASCVRVERAGSVYAC